MNIEPGDARTYLEAEGLLDLLLDSPSDPTQAAAFAPDLRDLARLHQLIRRRRAFTVMEFGIGYSTITISDALAKNESEWAQLPRPPHVRNRFMWQVFAVDARKEWIRVSVARIPDHLRPRVSTIHSPVSIGSFQGQLCHFYDTLPDVVPDFVYLDGPDPQDVIGAVHGLSFACEERTVLAGDLLLMESTMLPGAFILIDGRTNNARFLHRNFSRTWDHHWYPDADVTTFELKEDRLGPYNILGADPFADLATGNGGDS